MRKHPIFTDDVLDKILQTHNTQEAIFGSDGIVKDLIQALTQRALQTEMKHHLGYEKHASTGKNSGNSRNGTSKKSIQTEQGALELEIPRDRKGEFEPILVPKHARRLPGFTQKILQLFMAGLTEGQIQSQVQELYGVEVSTELVSEITDDLLDEMDLWQNRPLDAIYPILWVDGFVMKIRHQGTVQNRTIYVVLGLKMTGKKELLGFWVDGAEGSKFWLRVLQELRKRGVQDVLIGCMDGLTGFPQAWKSVFPEAVVQTCVVHLIRNSLEYLSWKERKVVAQDLKPIYTAINEEQAEQALTRFEETWGKYSAIGRMWRRRWEDFRPFLAYPEEIRHLIYTTNGIEAINQQFRRAVDQRGHFTTERGALKALFVVVKRLERKWTHPIHNWSSIRQQFSILFPNRFSF